MNKYTIILLVPDDATNNYGECQTLHVEATTARAALRKARQEAVDIFQLRQGRAIDFVPVAIFLGCHLDITREAL